MKTRVKCLRCNKTFLSEDKRCNRICENCHKVNKDIQVRSYKILKDKDSDELDDHDDSWMLH